MQAQLRKNRINRAVLLLFVFLFLLIVLYPILFMVQSSLKSNNEISMRPIYTLPSALHFENYANAVRITNMGMLFKNTSIVTFASLAVVLILSANASFAISKMRWRGAQAVSKFLTMGMFIPMFVLLLPQFIMLKDIGLLNTRAGLIVLFGTGISLPIYLMNGFYRYIPDPIMEASVIDGCGIGRMYLHVIMPMSANGYVTVLMLTFFTIWNDLLICKTFTSSSDLRMIQAAWPRLPTSTAAGTGARPSRR